MEAKNVSKDSCWKRRTTLEKTFICGFVILILVFLIALIIYAIIVSCGEPEVKTCLTPECVQIASRMLQAVDRNVDPCEDFFEYSCGSWNRQFTIPSDRPNYSRFRKRDDDLQEDLRELLEAPISERQSKAIQKTKTLYASCLNMTALEEVGEEPLLKLLSDYGGWPLLQKGWNERNFDLSKQLARVRLLSYSVFVSCSIHTDDKNSDANIIAIDQANLGMPSRDYFLRSSDNKSLTAYTKLATDLALALGAPEKTVHADVKDMIDFEIRLANITMPEEQKRDKDLMYTSMNMNNMTIQFGRDPINWNVYLGDLMASVNITVDPQERIVVYAYSYIQDLAVLLAKTSKRTQANYIMWHLVKNKAYILSQKFLEMLKEYNKVMQGTENDRARWRFCVSKMNDNLPMVVGRMYVEKFFDQKSKETALKMIRRLREAFKDQLTKVTWLKEKTKVVAREKADAIQEKIGFPEYIYNDTYLDSDLEKVDFKANKLFENMIKLQKNHMMLQLKFLREKVDKERWASPPAMANAFYSTARNQIIFPAGILHPPFYHESYPMSINYGGIGMVIGHEITHGFDDKGRMYDKFGNMHEWWDAEDSQNFKDKAQCIIDQYSNYTIPEIAMNINGKQTQGENIADNGGLKQAFQAYHKWVEAHSPEPQLPGLNMTPQQIFFLSFAQVWCGTSRPESSIHNIRASRHSPGNIRVLGTLSNSVDFAKAFNCPLGSRMNPAQKCVVW